jgi:thiamine biosynthesis lipoprotein
MKTTTPENTVDQQRRSFLKLSGLLGLGVAGAALLPAEKAEAMLFGKKEFKVSKTKLAMGSYVAITAIHSSRDQAEQAIGLAFQPLRGRHSADHPQYLWSARRDPCGIE